MNEAVVGVVVLAYGDEPLLAEVLDAAISSTGVSVHLTVVDNGYTGSDAAALQARPVRWVTPGKNTGFAGGCNYGAARSQGDYIAFLNSDAVIASDALAALVAALADPAVGIATAQVLLYDEPDIINSAGNPIHYSLLSWAGGLGDPVTAHSVVTEPAGASGALMMLRRSLFDDLEGFYEVLFAYAEDLDLSLRTWQAGYSVRYVPDARVWHKYDFSRNPDKYFLLERNRWINILTLYEGRTLLRLALELLAVEAGIWSRAFADGWWRQKVRASLWVVANRDQVRARRRWVQGRRVVSDSALMDLLESRITPSERTGESVPGAVNSMIEVLGRLAFGAGSSRRRKLP